MHPSKCEAIRRHTEDMIACLNVAPLMDKMQWGDLLTSEDVAEVNETKIPQKQVRELLKILMRKEESVQPFERFLEALRATGGYKGLINNIQSTYETLQRSAPSTGGATASSYSSQVVNLTSANQQNNAAAAALQPIPVDCKNALTSNLIDLIDHLDLEYIVRYMKSKHHLTNTDEDNINALLTNGKKINEFVNILQRQSYAAFLCFLEGLERKPQQAHVRALFDTT